MQPMESEIDPATKDALDFAARCLALDLEVGKADSKIHQFGAVRLEAQTAIPQTFSFRQGPLGPALAQLDAFADGAHFTLGHNVILFDLPVLASAKPDLLLLGRPALDTLWLSPLAFPANPYHRLVKHYQDGQLRSGQKNNPVEDARLALRVLVEQFTALRKKLQSDPALLLAWHWLTSQGNAGEGFEAFFRAIRQAPPPAKPEALAAIEALLAGKVCQSHGREALASVGAGEGAWVLAYVLAWLSVAGTHSVIAPWVRHQFPEVSTQVRKLRDTPCGDPACAWCAARHDATHELRRWFPALPGFRPTPVDAQGQPLQRAIVQAALQGRHVLGILPTGTGKSICYQIPALSRYDKTGALTVVISPLVALMADQVSSLEARGISCAAAINGLLSMPERAAVLERLRLGDIAILIIAPEQLRSHTLRQALGQREIGAWVLDEAHCLSKWGHDFRPDYRYVGRFIKERAGHGPVPPILCLTATAKPDVVQDMLEYFAAKVGVEMALFDGGASRDNLAFEVRPTTPPEKLTSVWQLLMQELPPSQPGGAIVYCATRKKTEQISEFLQHQGLRSGHFHAGLPPEAKKTAQEGFIRGDLSVICATNAFGMGIDKPDVRLVIHADMPGSLENYLQEAGRAGRDRQSAKCVLLYTPEDVERQFGMSARSRLRQQEISAVLKSLRSLDRKKNRSGEVIATAGEILTEESDGAFERDCATDDTRVRTAVAWLEEAALLERDENRVQVFPSSLRITSLEEARKKLIKQEIFERYRAQLLQIVETLFEADPDEGISTDELMGRTGLSPQQIRKAMNDLETLGLCSNDMALTAFVHVAVEDASIKRRDQAARLEVDVIEAMQTAAGDMGRGETTILQLRHMTQHLKDQGHVKVLPEHVRRIIRSLSEDGRGTSAGGSLRLRSRDSETLEVTLQRHWPDLRTTAQLRRVAAARVLEHLVERLPPGTKGKDLLADTTVGELMRAMMGDLDLKARVRDADRLLDRALMWLHEQEVIRLHKGLAVFRSAMTIRLEQSRRGFTKADFSPLALHYGEQVTQIHVMDEYVQRGMGAMMDATRLAMDYFQLDQGTFLRRWMSHRDKELARQTTPASWHQIVEALGNAVQKDIVTDEREQTSVLVLAGPGSGKTRVLVHRIAYLIRVRREKPEGILALAYNRHAAVEIRRRLKDLIGDDARGVLVMTCHAMAMRLVGASFAGQMDAAHSANTAVMVETDAFRQVLLDAIALLRGDGLPPEEADDQRDRLLAGFRWILVDEYQDIGPEQYELISALAGRTRQDEEGRLSLFAVGDDDQNIYAFSGASVDFIRRFERDYKARPRFLVENYRSSAHIVEAANAVIAPASDRMKVDHPIVVNQGRRKDAAGGLWAEKDALAGGHVQLLDIEVNAAGPRACQAAAIMQELERLSQQDSLWRWERCAVIARQWDTLEPVRAWCEMKGIPVQTAREEELNVWPLRETQQLVHWLRQQGSKLLSLDVLQSWVKQQSSNPWWLLLGQALEAYGLDVAGIDLPGSHVIEWLAEWSRQTRRRQSGLLLLTAHRAKGLEFDHVAVLDGHWRESSWRADAHESRRLFYVAMTRARQTLVLAQAGGPHAFYRELASVPSVLKRQAGVPSLASELGRRYITPSMREIDLGFAGRYLGSHRVHRDIACLEPGDALGLRHDGQRWVLTDTQGHVVGRMARAFAPPEGMTFMQARVVAIQVRSLFQVAEEFQPSMRTSSWEVVVPELVFLGGGQAP